MIMREISKRQSGVVADASGDERQPVLEIRDLVKVYPHKAGEVRALKEITFNVYEGEFVSIMGQSGSGKSTLLHVLACLHQLTSGRYRLENVDVSSLDDLELSKIRNEKIGMVFQKFNLLAQENILENVALPLVYAGVGLSERRKLAEEKLRIVGLGDRLDHRPTELSGGQSQRVAIARALVMDPALLLADEPTGNLDSATGDEIMGVFQALHRRGRTIVQVTHDREKAEYSERIIHLKDGRIAQVETIKNPRQAPEIELREP